MSCIVGLIDKYVKGNITLTTIETEFGLYQNMSLSV